MFFTEKLYMRNNEGSKNLNTKNIITLRVISMSELRCVTRKFATLWAVTSVQSLSSPPQINILLSVTREIQNVLTIHNTHCCCPWDLSCCSLHCLPDKTSALIPRFFRIERKLSLTCMNTQTTLQYEHQKRATILIVTILFDIIDCNNNIPNNNKREGRIKSGLGMDDFHWFYKFFYCFFLVIFYVFFLRCSTFLFDFLYIFKCFWL